MERLKLQVLRPGPQSLLQDLGRVGHRQHGISLAGALDRPALVLANLLVGNAPPAVAIEVAQGGLEVQALSAGIVGVAGQGLDVWHNGQRVVGQRCIPLQPSDRLRFQFSPNGSRAYLAVPGGFQVAPVLGSSSTHLRSGLGPPAIGRGDVLEARLPARPMGGPCFVPISPFPEVLILRALRGPEWQDHPGLQQVFQVTAASDRMGTRLQGEAVRWQGGAEMYSVGVMPGTVQLPPGGQPIVLLADAQTTGGYPRVLQVIQADLWKAGQVLRGQKVQFQLVDFEEAERALQLQQRELQHLQHSLQRQDRLRHGPEL